MGTLSTPGCSDASQLVHTPSISWPRTVRYLRRHNKKESTGSACGHVPMVESRGARRQMIAISRARMHPSGFKASALKETSHAHEQRATTAAFTIGQITLPKQKKQCAEQLSGISGTKSQAITRTSPPPLSCGLCLGIAWAKTRSSSTAAEGAGAAQGACRSAASPTGVPRARR